MQDKSIYVHKHFTPKVYLIVRNLFIYLSLLGLWAWTVNMYATFGQGWIKMAVAIMWIAGAIGVWGIPEERESTIKETKWAVFGYLAFLILYRLVIVRFAQFSPDEVGIALGVNMPVSAATSALGFIQNILMIVSIMVPIGFAIWIGQKFKVQQGRKKKDEAFWKYKGIRRDFNE